MFNHLGSEIMDEVMAGDSEVPNGIARTVPSYHVLNTKKKKGKI
jgi:hypothetical protein